MASLRTLTIPRPIYIVVGVLGLLLLAGCQQAGDMAQQPRLDPLERSELFADQRASRSWPEGVVAQVERPVDDPYLTGLDLNGEPLAEFPLEVTADVIARGQERFGIYCTPCHGPAGAGDGRVVPFGMPQPANLVSEPLVEAPNGHFFDVISYGFGQMFPYGYRVKAGDRWAIIAYIRALQLRGGAVEGELSTDEINQIANWGAQP